MSFDAVGPYSPKKKYHWKEGKETLEESIHNVKPLDLNMAHLKPDDNSSDPSDSDDEEVVEVVEESTHVDDDEDASSYEEVESVIEEEIVEDEEMEEQTDPNKSSSLGDVAGEPEMEVDSSMQDDSPTQEDKPHSTSKPETISSTPTPPTSAVQNMNSDEQVGNLAWSKPEWTKKTPLKSTNKGKVLKEGGTVSAPITKIAEVAAENKDLSFKKPDWTMNTKLKSTGKADALKSGQLEKPITALPHMGKNYEGNEATMLEKSNAAQDSPTHVEPPPSESDADDGKNIVWEKPDWTKKPVLKETAKGEKLKSGAVLSRPIGGIKPVEE